MPYIVKTLRPNISLPNGKFYAYANSTAQLTDDEYDSIAAIDFSNGTLELVSRIPDDDDEGGGSSGGTIKMLNILNYATEGHVWGTDDWVPYQAAITAMWDEPGNAVVYIPPGATVKIPLDPTRLTYDSVNHTRAAFPIKDVSPNSVKLVRGLVGAGYASVTRSNPYSGGQAGLVKTASIIEFDYDPDDFEWSETEGLPCLFGGPDRDLVGATGNHFANVHAVLSNIIIVQPVNPSLTVVNLQAVSTCTLYEVRADVTVPLDQVPEPTHPTGAAFLLPDSNNNVTVDADKLMAIGHYTGVPVSELCYVREATAYRCKVAIVVPRGNSHACHLGHINVQQCPWGIAGWDPSAEGPNEGVVPAGGTVLQIDWLDMEDYDYGGDQPWMYAPGLGAHIYANGDLRGEISKFYRVNSGSVSESGGPVRTDLFVNGGAGMAVYSATGGATASVKKATTHVPTNPEPPGTPTIGTATAGVEQASVAFTPAGSGGTATSFRAISTPGGITATGSASPIVVTGLTAGTPYTFKVRAQNATGNSADSAASNSVTPTAPVAGEQTLFTGNGPSNNAGADPNTSIGLQVNPTADTDAIGIRFWKPGTDNMGTVTGGIFEINSDGTPIGLVSGTAVTFSVSGTGWQRADFTAPVTLESGHLYKVEYFTQNGFYSYQTHRFDSTFDGVGGAFTVGTIDVPSADTAPTAAANAQCSFHQGTGSLTYAEVPSPNAAWYGLDLVFAAA